MAWPACCEEACCRGACGRTGRDCFAHKSKSDEVLARHNFQWTQQQHEGVACGKGSIGVPVNTAAGFARGYPPRADGKWNFSIAGARLGRYSAFRFFFLFLFLACYHDVPYFFLAFASCICPCICLSTFCIVFLRFFDLVKSSSISTTPTFHRDPETRCCSTLRPRHMEFNIRAAHIDRRSTSTY